MIQRIQSIFLLFAAIFMGALLFLPLAELLSPNGKIYYMFSKGIRLQDTLNISIMTIPFLAFVIIITLLFVTIIFLYKNRILQMRLCVFNMLLILGLHGLFLFHLHVAKKELSVLHVAFNISIVFPVISLILGYLAYREIRKDELLVKSYDRIR